jgi:hypothetical protein
LAVARDLTNFENDRRADLIAGRGKQWEVSSPRDELEKLRFFARQIELLVDRAEESEIQSLKTSVQHLSQDRQDEFWQWHYPIHWDDIFRSAIRSSLVVTLATFLETYLDELCKNVALVTKSEFDSMAGKGSTLARALRFLRAAGQFYRPDPSAWEEVGTFFKIRNVVVHNAGFAAGSKYEKAIEGFCSGRSDIRLSYGTVEIEPEFFEFVIDRLLAFIEQLESEFLALCDRTRRLEGS